MVFIGLKRLPQQTRVITAFLCVLGTAAWAQEKRPVPDAAVLAGAQKLVRDVYGKEYDAAKTPKEKTELAEKLLDQATKSKGDPAGHFVLLRVAKDVSVLVSDAKTALGAVERIVAAYDVDAKATRLDCVKRLEAAAKLSSQYGALAEQAHRLIDVALAEDDFEAASQFGEIARESARRARNYALLKEVVARLEKSEELQQAHAEYRKAMARLEENPTDPEANLTVGRYRCLVKGNWDEGIPLLALGTDAGLRALAARELGEVTKTAQQIELGDGWWKLAEDEGGAAEQTQLRQRAVFWYQKALPQLTGLDRLRAARRLEMISETSEPMVADTPTVTLRGAVLVMTFEPKTFISKGDQIRVADASGRNNHGQVHHATLVRDGKVGSALFFDGRQSQIMLPSLRSALVGSKAFSACFWLRFGGTGNGQPRFAFDVGYAGETSITIVLYHPSTISFNLPTKHGGKRLECDMPQPGQWHHVAATFDGSRQRLYIDGVVKAEEATGQLTLNEISLGKEAARIGSLAKKHPREKDRFFPGLLDEFAVFSACLSDAEIKALYQMGLAGKGLGQR